ncbi:MAG: hypothetical protein WAK95_02810 [Desulfobacterales bacterium]
MDALKMKFNHQDNLIGIVDDETLYLVEITSRGDSRAVGNTPLQSMVGENPQAEKISAAIKGRRIALLIVPDYWFGNATYKFQSRKKSLAEAYVTRKLQEQFPEQPEVGDFFELTFYLREKNEKWVYAFFLQDPHFFQLYQKLSRLNLQPHQITCPALIWQEKIRQSIPDFDKGGKGFVQLLTDIGLLYFYSEGRFLFSRSIPLPEGPSAVDEKYASIVHEVNQSLYLFSQKTKSEIDQLYLVAGESDSRSALSSAFDRDIQDLNPILADAGAPAAAGAAQGAIGFLGPKDIVSAGDFASICHRALKKELEWKPVQTAATALGVILLVLLGLEATVLYRWSNQMRLTGSHGRQGVTIEESQNIQQYNQALEVLLGEAKRSSPQEVLHKLARSLPPNVRIQEVVLEVEETPGVTLKAFVRSIDQEQFKACLSALTAGLNANFKDNRPMTVADIDFEVKQNQPLEALHDYIIKFRLDL